MKSVVFTLNVKITDHVVSFCISFYKVNILPKFWNGKQSWKELYQKLQTVGMLGMEIVYEYNMLLLYHTNDLHCLVIICVAYSVHCEEKM